MPGFGLLRSAFDIEPGAVESVMFHAVEFSSIGNSTMKFPASSNQKMRGAMYHLHAQRLPNRPCRLRLRIIKIGDSTMHQDGHGHDEHLLEFLDLLPLLHQLWTAVTSGRFACSSVRTDAGRQL